MPAARFRARPWPVVRGSERELRAKRAAHPTRDRNRNRSCSSFSTMLDSLEESELGVQMLFSDERWRRRMSSICRGYYTTPQDQTGIYTTDVWDAEFLELEIDMRNNEWGDRPYAAERCLLEWILEHHLHSLIVLLDDCHVDTSNDLFEPFTGEWQPFGGGEPESLLAIAAKHVCSPEAVRLLLARGADPNAELVHLSHLSFNDELLPTRGPGGLAWNDVRGYWRGNGTEPATDATMAEILTALAEAGGQMHDAHDAYASYDGLQDFTAQRALSARLLDAEHERNKADRRQRLETLVAVVGIVSFWRRAAAAPDSKAAIAAIARAAKRARQTSDNARV